MTKTIGLSLVLLSTLMLSGCGSNADRTDSSSQQLIEPSIPTPTKVDRANWEGIDEQTDGLAIVAQGDNISFKIRNDHIAGHHYRTEQIYIDSDNNPNTGYSWHHGDQVGAEYLVEGDNLYRHGADGWHWNFVSKVNTRVIDGNQLEVEFPRSLLNASDTIRAKAALNAQNWNFIMQTNIASFDIEDDNGNNTNGLNISFDSQAHTLTIEIQSPVLNDPNFGTEEILIDSDNNAQTGYSSGWSQIGADYLIEGDRLYSHAGENNHWSWREIGTIGDVERTINNQTLTVTLHHFTLDTRAQGDSLAVFLNIPIRVSAVLSSRNWRAMERYDITTFDFQGYKMPVEEHNEDTENVGPPYPPQTVEYSPNRRYLLMAEDAPQIQSSYFIIDMSDPNNQRIGELPISYFGDPQEAENAHFINNTTVRYEMHTIDLDNHFHQVFDYNFITGTTTLVADHVPNN